MHGCPEPQLHLCLVESVDYHLLARVSKASPHSPFFQSARCSFSRLVQWLALPHAHWGVISAKDVDFLAVVGHLLHEVLDHFVPSLQLLLVGVLVYNFLVDLHQVLVVLLELLWTCMLVPSIQNVIQVIDQPGLVFPNELMSE